MSLEVAQITWHLTWSPACHGSAFNFDPSSAHLQIRFKLFLSIDFRRFHSISNYIPTIVPWYSHDIPIKPPFVDVCCLFFAYTFRNAGPASHPFEHAIHCRYMRRLPKLEVALNHPCEKIFHCEPSSYCSYWGSWKIMEIPMSQCGYSAFLVAFLFLGDQGLTRRRWLESWHFLIIQPQNGYVHIFIFNPTGKIMNNHLHDVNNCKLADFLLLSWITQEYPVRWFHLLAFGSSQLRYYHAHDIFGRTRYPSCNTYYIKT